MAHVLSLDNDEIDVCDMTKEAHGRLTHRGLNKTAAISSDDIFKYVFLKEKH